MNKRLRSLVALLVVLVVVLGGGYYLVSRSSLFPGHIIKDSGSNISDYTAVFLTNGQVYFGKMYTINDPTEVDLRDIYYLQVNSTDSNLQSGANSSTNANNIQLVKLGNELHGPNDRMLINRAQVLFTESLKSDGKVVTAINNSLSGK